MQAINVFGVERALEESIKKEHKIEKLELPVHCYSRQCHCLLADCNHLVGFEHFIPRRGYSLAISSIGLGARRSSRQALSDSKNTIYNDGIDTFLDLFL